VAYDVETPPAEHVYLMVRYSKHSPATIAIDVYLDGRLRASFLPADLNSWNTFHWTDSSMDLGAVEGGTHCLRFESRGQTHGVADLDVFELSFDSIAD
jgi:hypothetical protein